MAEGYWKYRETNPVTGKDYFNWVKGPKPEQEEPKKKPESVLPPRPPNTHAGHVGEALDKDAEDRREEWEKERGIDQLKTPKPQE
jgi:hypothetical protein